MKIRVTTFNIQHGRNHNLEGDVIDLPMMAHNAADTGAVITGFNEVRKGGDPDDGAFPDTPRILAERLGGECVFGKAISLGTGRDYGNALVSRYPVLKSEIIPIPDPDESERRGKIETRCVIRALIDVEGRELTVLQTHFGLSPEERRNAAETVIKTAESIDTPVLFMGDLNSDPDDPVIKKLCAVFTDCAAALGCEENTFPSDSPSRRIDYIFVRNIKPAEIHAVKKVVSDHFALTAEIELD